MLQYSNVRYAYRGFFLFLSCRALPKRTQLATYMCLLLALAMAWALSDKPTATLEQQRYYTNNGIWERLITTRLIGPFFDPPSQNKPEYLSNHENLYDYFNDVPLGSPKSPLLRYLQHTAKTGFQPYVSVDDTDDIAGARVLTFLDDPICDVLVFSSGLFVCGDAYIHNSVTITSSINETELILAKMSPGRPLTQAYLDRCLLRHAPPSSTDFMSINISWCYKELNIKSAQVYVIDQAEFGANLIASSIHVEMGARLFVGLRSILYSNARLSGKASAIAGRETIQWEETSDESSPTNRRKRLSRVIKSFSTFESDSPFGRPEENAFRNPLTPSPVSDSAKFTSASPRHARSTNPPRHYSGSHFYLTKEELSIMTCPMIDIVTGSIDIIDTDIQKATISNYRGPISTTDPPTASIPRRMTSSSHLLNEFSGLKDTWSFKNPFAQSISTTYSATSTDLPHANLRDSYLPPLPPGTSIGDIRALRGHVVIETGAFVWVYGNLAASKGVHVREGSDLHLNCGHFVTGIPNSTGLVLSQGATVSSGGLLESVLPSVLLQKGSQLRLIGSLLATRYIQGVSGSLLEICGEVFASLMSLKEGTKARIHQALEVETILDVSDGSELTLLGTIGVGYLQVVDGSSVEINRSADNNASDPHVHTERTREQESIPQPNKEMHQVAVVDDTLLIDCRSTLMVKGISLLVHSSVFVTNQSQLYLDQGNLYLERPGAIHVIGSQLMTRGHCIASYGSLLVGFGSIVHIAGNLYVHGVTWLDQEWSSKESISTWGHSMFDSKRDTEIKSDNSSRIDVRPALYIQDSEVTVRGTVEVLNSWVELSRRSTLKVGGNGLITLHPNKSFVSLQHSSSLLLNSGTLMAGKALLVASGSTVRAMRDTPVVSLGDVEISHRSHLQCSSLRTFGNLQISDHSVVSVTNHIIVGGALLNVTTKSQLSCQALHQKRGDVFIVNRARVTVNHGPFWVYGSVVTQAASQLHIKNGSLTAVQGDVISENLSHLSVDGPLLLFSAYYIQTKVGNLKSSIHIANETNGAIHAQQILSYKNESMHRKSDAQYDTLVDNAVGTVRRTPDSQLSFTRVIPYTTVVKVYQQKVNRIRYDNSTAAGMRHSWIAQRATTLTQQGALHQKEEFIQQVNRPTTWEALNYHRLTS